MSAVDDDDKGRVLWKQIEEVVDIHKGNLYTDTSERPFVRQTLNKEVFGLMKFQIHLDLFRQFGLLLVTIIVYQTYSVENLQDASFNSLYLNGNTTYQPGTRS